MPQFRSREDSQEHQYIGPSVFWALALILNALLTHYALEVSDQLKPVSTCLAPYYLDAITYQLDGANGTLRTTVDEASVNEDWKDIIQYLGLYSTCEMIVSVAVAGMLVGSLSTAAGDAGVSSYVYMISSIIVPVTMIPSVTIVVSRCTLPCFPRSVRQGSAPPTLRYANLIADSLSFSLRAHRRCCLSNGVRSAKCAAGTATTRT
eukprot:COSAG02_NODE_2007_length_10128_cov_5.313989_11_plen_206_part_00